MSALYQNAVASIRMGVEDYARDDANRAMSAVRNFYAGVLLLAKEVLVRSAPDAEMDEIIGAKYKPVPDGNGGVEYIPDGQQTIDFNTLSKRFADFGLKIDPRALNNLNRIRNDIEHRYTEQPHEAVREAIAKAFPLTIELFDFLEEDPTMALGDAWQSMLETSELFARELASCRISLASIKWHSGTIQAAQLQCTKCGSELVHQVEAGNADQESAELKCRACGSGLEVEKVVVAALAEELAHEAFIRVKDGGEDGPIFHCPQCMLDAYVDFEEICAVCGYEHVGAECARCGTGINLAESIYGESSSLCSYCENVSWKVMRD